MVIDIKNKAMAGKYSSSRGFTLIEVMIVVVIVAILAAVALPSYHQYVERSRRVDAKETLTRIATLQERHFFHDSTYSATLDRMGGGASPEGWYNITLEDCGAEPCSTFTIIATAVGPQLGDEDCRTFSIDQTLRQAAESVGGGDTTDICW